MHLRNLALLPVGASDRPVPCLNQRLRESRTSRHVTSQHLSAVVAVFAVQTLPGFCRFCVDGQLTRGSSTPLACKIRERTKVLDVSNTECSEMSDAWLLGTGIGEKR